MIRILVLAVCAFGFSSLTAQKKDTLDYIVKPFGLYGYKVNQKVVPKSDFFYTYAKDATTVNEFKSGRLNTTIGTILTYTGGLMLGWQLGDMIFKKSDGYTKAMVGGGLLAVGIPMGWIGQNKSTKALATFNASDQMSLPPVKMENLSESPNNEASFLQRIQNSCYIVRVPVSAQKIRYYQERADQKGISEEAQQKYLWELDKVTAENNAFIDLLQKSFDSHFSLGNVYFLPDSSYRAYAAGEKTGFINSEGIMDKNLTCPHSENFFLISGKHKEQMIFLDQNLHKLDAPFPYKKNTFLPIFKLVLNQKGYIDTQVKYFDKKLNAQQDFNRNE